MKERETTKTKTMNKHQSPERSEDLNERKNDDHPKTTDKRRQSMGGVFVYAVKHLCIIWSVSAVLFKKTFAHRSGG